MQLVERGLIDLNDPIDKILLKLASQPILNQREDGSLETLPAKRLITLRNLLTHSSGATYDWIDPQLTACRISRSETPRIVEDGNIAKGYAYPRAYEAGQGWAHSGGLDWASLLVARLTNTCFEGYVGENIAKPLGITSFTWHRTRKPEVAQKLMTMTTRLEDGALINSTTPFWPDPVAEGGGAGMYTNVHDYTRVLSDLLKTSPTLLRKETVDHISSPQFAEDSPALAGLKANGEFAYKCALDDSMEGVNRNQGLGGLLLMEDAKREKYFKPKGTMSWTGLPNLLWSVNRERGVALMVAMQILPRADWKSFDLIARFETAVWRHLKAE